MPENEVDPSLVLPRNEASWVIYHWIDVILLASSKCDQRWAGYQEFAEGFKPVRNGKIFWMNNKTFLFINEYRKTIKLY